MDETRTTRARSVLACDVGGTNTSIALLGRGEGRSFGILRRFRFRTQELGSLNEAVAEAIGQISTDPSVAAPEYTYTKLFLTM